MLATFPKEYNLKEDKALLVMDKTKQYYEKILMTLFPTGPRILWNKEKVSKNMSLARKKWRNEEALKGLLHLKITSIKDGRTRFGGIAPSPQ